MRNELQIKPKGEMPGKLEETLRLLFLFFFPYVCVCVCMTDTAVSKRTEEKSVDNQEARFPCGGEKLDLQGYERNARANDTMEKARNNGSLCCIENGSYGISLTVPGYAGNWR